MEELNSNVNEAPAEPIKVFAEEIKQDFAERRLAAMKKVHQKEEK